MLTSETHNPGRTSSEAFNAIDEVGAHPVLQVLVGFCCFILAEFLGGILGVRIGGDIGLGVGGILAAILAVGGYLLIMRCIAKRSPVEIRSPGAWRELGAGLTLGTLLMGIVVGVAALAGAYRATGLNPNPAILGLVGISVMAGVAEEILFRGLLLRVLEHRVGTWWALGLTSALFGGLHLTNPEATPGGALAIGLEAGLLLGACFVVTRRLWLVMGVHAAWNFVQGGIFSSDVSGTGSENHGLLAATINGPAALTGGTTGFEGSLTALFVCLACALVLLIVAKRRGLILTPRARA
ncbi:CPBP family intramembrane glutamic endopeptidase [Actinomyces culturomici]|uniref:CPBP family intramembrane glutamic endopeptidase n=1 Tax=Actinomyces culturomici TaxID=1926276 RepID=UPI000E201ABC|nr:CPBP family intramembrane glutamic endopeptidase [Actinomyces culturomici]